MVSGKAVHYFIITVPQSSPLPVSPPHIKAPPPLTRSQGGSVTVVTAQPPTSTSQGGSVPVVIARPIISPTSTSPASVPVVKPPATPPASALKTPETSPAGFQNSNQKKIIIDGNKNEELIDVGVSAGCFGLFIVLLYVTVIYIRRRRSVSRETLSTTFKKKMKSMESTMNCGPKRFEFSEMKKMTNSFSEKIGEGGYGIVYRGKLDNGTLVAVKVVKVSKSDGEDFINEVTSISQTSHVNIVSLLGFSYNSKEIALVYEFMSNGSLDSFISKNHDLQMETIHRIVVGVAKGLEYLHSGCTTRIVHFDIKPQNILLDGDFNPKISDFGLAKLCKRKDSYVISMLGTRGTVGFIAPEVFSRAFGIVSYKSDVYSYGMLVLDLILGGKRNPTSKFLSDDSEMHFPSWVFKNFEEGQTLSSQSLRQEEEEMERKMVMVGLWCIQTSPFDRPSMSRVLDMLGGTIKSLEMPPKPSLLSATKVSTQKSNSQSLSSHKVV